MSIGCFLKLKLQLKFHCTHGTATTNKPLLYGFSNCSATVYTKYNVLWPTAKTEVGEKLKSSLLTTAWDSAMKVAVADLEGAQWVPWNPSFEGLPSRILCANMLLARCIRSQWECWFPPCLTWITSCFAAFATRSAVLPLIHETQRLGLAVGRSSNGFHPKITPETISGCQKSSWGACSQTPPLAVHAI